MPEKHASAEIASSLNNERKYMTRYSKNYDKKNVQKCSSNVLRQKYKFHCTVFKVNLKCDSGGINYIETRSS